MKFLDFAPGYGGKLKDVADQWIQNHVLRVLNLQLRPVHMVYHHCNCIAIDKLYSHIQGCGN